MIRFKARFQVGAILKDIKTNIMKDLVKRIKNNWLFKSIKANNDFDLLCKTVIVSRNLELEMGLGMDAFNYISNNQK